MSDVILNAEDLCLTYSGHKRQSVEALKNVSFSIRQGEQIIVVGASGCGKSSLLSLISGVQRPSSGRVFYRGKEITGPSPERVIIFQDHALFPWKTAAQNIEFALKSTHFEGDYKKEALVQLDKMGLINCKDRYPRELSGGMQQRVGIARALAANPDILLLDEPFAALDAITRSKVLEEVTALVSSLKKTLIMVTHSVEEALFIGSRILVMAGHPGRVVGELPVVFEKPSTLIELKRHPRFIEEEIRVHKLLQDYPQAMS